MDMLALFKKFLFNVELFLKQGKTTGPKIKLIGSEAVEKQLLSPQLLSKWTHLTLQQRVELILKKYKVKISAHKLRLFYRRNNMRYRQTAMKPYPHHRSPEQLEQERMEWALMITDYIANDYPIIYMDESAFNIEMRQSRVWHSRDSKPIINAPEVRGKGWTLYGAISTCLRNRNSYFEIGKSTN
jgi:hypothetical protein